MPAFYRDFLNKPQPLNHFQTMNRYWMEDSQGKYGVQLDAFGPYRLPGRTTSTSYDQGGTAHGAATPRTARTRAARPVPPELPHATPARRGQAGRRHAPRSPTYDNVFYVSAGEDESSTWQEFGEMKWMTKEEVPDAFGPKLKWPLDQTQTNWAVSRYVPWSSWASASTNWPNA